MEKPQKENEKEVTVVRCNITVETSKEKQAVNDIEKQKAPSVHSQTNTAMEDPGYHPERPKTLREKINVGIRVFVIAFAMFMVWLNSIVIGPALMTGLNGFYSPVWIEIAYFLSLTSFRSSLEKFFDIFGRKVAFLFAISLFLIGCLINFLATTINMLFVGRTIQSFGCGGVITVAYIIVTDIAPIRLRPLLQSMIIRAIYSLSLFLRSSKGGSFVDKLNWHWIFWLNAIYVGITCIITVQQGTSARQHIFLE